MDEVRIIEIKKSVFDDNNAGENLRKKEFSF